MSGTVGSVGKKFIPVLIRAANVGIAAVSKASTAEHTGQGTE